MIDIFNMTPEEATQEVAGIFADMGKQLAETKSAGKKRTGTPDKEASDRLKAQGAVPASAKSTYKEPQQKLPPAFSSNPDTSERRNQSNKPTQRQPIHETRSTVPFNQTLGRPVVVRDAVRRQPAISSKTVSQKPPKQPERETMTTKPQSTSTETANKTSGSPLRPVGELKHGMRSGDLLNGNEKSVEQTPPYPSISETQTNTGQGFLMDESIPIGGLADEGTSGKGSSGWLMSGKNVPKAYWHGIKTTPLADLLDESLLGFIAKSGPLDQIAESLWKGRYVVDGFEKAAGRFFEALSICRQSNRGNVSPEYQRAMAQLTQLGHAVLSTLKSYGLTAESHGFAVPQTTPAAADQGASTAAPTAASGNNQAPIGGRSAYDGGNDWYFDELAARRHAQQQQQNPQSWYLRTLNL